jgi:hypothetical protein
VNTTCPYGFHIWGDPSQPRLGVDASRALAGYASCAEEAKMEREAYLSAFTFGQDFRDLLESEGTVRGFTGPCSAPFIWWDIDREGDLEAALQDARTLALTLDQRYLKREDDLLIFFSGSKGFHLGLPTALWAPEPSPAFNKVARRFAEAAAERAGMRVDGSVYDKVRAFRAPNSRHPRTGLYKRRLSLDELLGLTLPRIVELAQVPEPFEVPAPTYRSEQAAADWAAAEKWVQEQAQAKVQRQAGMRGNGGAPKLTQQTRDFICNGAAEGDRHRLLFSAAANLAEFGCPPELAHELLSEPALDSGLKPADVRRQIECGLKHGANKAQEDKRDG